MSPVVWFGDGDAWVIPPEWTLPHPNDRPTKCRSCAAEILWLLTRAGKRAPVNRDGKSHFATCPQARSWRNKK